MKRIVYLICLWLGTQLGFAQTKYKAIYPEADTVSLIRNPCMGWGLYDDANDEVQNADTYWKAQDAAARAYGSFFYVRWRWSDMEPEEGRYAWLYDENYKKLIQGALDRGLKLCFRIYVNSQDNIRQSTPDYVRKAGAKGYMASNGEKKLWTPYPDDPIFLAKLETFVKAFAKEYDDPDRVDFVDGYNIGWWGECHNIRLQHPENLELVFDRITTIYSSAFKHVLLALPFGSQVGFEAEKRIAIEPKGYVMRRDGLGSMWFSDAEMDITQNMYGRTLFIGESCWWQSCSDSVRPYATDTKYKLENWRDVYELTSQQALSYGFNTLDLRELPETKGWTTRAADLVRKFIAKGGYRLYPKEVTLPVEAQAGSTLLIKHVWKNLATGYLPNNVKNWDYKYKPAFALLNEKHEVVKLFVDLHAEPSAWLRDSEHAYSFPVSLEGVPAGIYTWAVSIIDRSKGNRPGIALALEESAWEGWYPLTHLQIIE